ncbi:MAG: hypothetical protein RIR70_498 [Pseudomonadota bacterium]
MTQTDILITGRVRHPQIFLTVIEMALQLRSQGVARRVIFSGWGEDFEQFPSLADHLAQHDVLAINNGPSLKLRSVGNYWDQIKTLETGLECIEDGVHVFKTRTDMLFANAGDTLAQIIADNIAIPCGVEGFRHRIWIPSFVALQPFFMADQCFFGLAEDLRQLINYDASIEARGIDIPLFPGSATHPAAASAEIRLWITPFLARYPQLREYLNVFPFSMNGHPHYPAIQQFQLQSSFYQEYLAIYWQLLARIFRVSPGHFVIAQGLDDEGRVIVRARSHDNPLPDFIDGAFTLKTPFPVSCSCDQGLHRFLASGLQAPYFAEFSSAASRVLDYRQTPERRDGFRSYLNALSEVAAPSTPRG